MKDIFDLLKGCKSNGKNELVLPKDTYHIYEEKTYNQYVFMPNNDHSLKNIAFLLEDFEDFTVDASGSEFIFHGRILPFLVQRSKNITIKNLSIDYVRPFYTYGEILKSTKTCIELKIPYEEYPYRVEYGRLIFCGDTWEDDTYWMLLELDKNTLAPAWGVGDHFLFNKKIFAEELKKGILRLTGEFDVVHKEGNYLAFHHEKRYCPSFFLNQSDTVRLENINIYHSGAMGVLGQNTKDITLHHVNVLLREGSGRVLSANADATHFVNCTGIVTLDGCRFEHQFDDPMNVHGIYTVLTKIIEPNTIEVRLMHHQQVGADIYCVGDTLSFLDRNTMLPYANAQITGVEAVNKEYIRIKLNYLPEKLKLSDVVENPDRMPAIVVRNCYMGKNRARGLLTTTKKDVLIENNHFYTAGAAVLIEGDANKWFESGAVQSVTIRNNTFENCRYAPWAEAVIQVSPSVNDRSGACYHKNICIESNTFLSFDGAILNARCVDGLTVTQNTITKTEAYPPFDQTEAMFVTEDAEHVSIKNNTIEGFKNMKLSSGSECGFNENIIK